MAGEFFDLAERETSQDESRRAKSLVARLQEYAQGTRDDFRDVPIDIGHATAFQKSVLTYCRQIPYGATASYAALAARAGFPNAARAVGHCMALNRVPILIPCHRVVRADGQIGNYSAYGGSKTKQRLLSLEARNVQP
jgi:methylated-DNA-[protein]-cysteine S-methyltransferase